MKTCAGQVINLQPKAINPWLGITLLFAILAALLILATPIASQAAANQVMWQDEPTATFTPTPISYFPIILKLFPRYTQTATSTFTVTGTPPATGTPTSTVTNTPTITATPTNTSTGTLPTPTRTPTGPTPTISTTPTQTATGTITPYIVVTAIASPTQANINGTIVFQFKIANRGTIPATNVAFFDALPAFMDITSVTTSKGSKTSDTHSTTVTIGTLNVNEVVTINVNTKVNSGAVTQNHTNTITITYDPSKSINKSVSYMTVGSTLPGTGELPIEQLERAGPDLSLLFLSLTLGLGAIFAIWYGFWARSNQMNGVKWYFGVGLVLVAAAVVTGLAGSGLLQSSPKNPPVPISRADTPAPLENTPLTPQDFAPEMLAGYEIAPAFEPTQRGRLPVYKPVTAEPLETLPSYPIPTPTIVVTPQAVTETLDTSPVVRLVIPSLNVDAVVKYVPWDTSLETWLISGLHQEIAWLGGSSWPGLGSNTVLAGHVTIRDYGNGPFRYLDQLAAGDEIIVYTDAKVYTYHVRESTVVAEDELWVTDPTENAQITLITCTDWSREAQAYQKRLIIFADLVNSIPISISTGN